MKLTWFEEIFKEYYVNYITIFLFFKSYPNHAIKKPLRFFSKILILLIAVLNRCSDKGSVKFFWTIWTA